MIEFISLPATLWFELNHGIVPQFFVQKKISFNTIKNFFKVEIAYVTTTI